MRASRMLSFMGLASSALAEYVIEDDYEPSSFFSMFDFFTSADPTNGYVNYVDQSTAESEGLINTNNGAVYMGVDHSNVATGSGRSSVRITSTKSYNKGLVILDLAHMPGGVCGTWPAFWTVGPSWPNNGEIDIIEGVNSQDSNSMTLHTAAGCSITNDGQYKGTMTTPNCNVAAAGQTTNAGCQINDLSTSSYGSGFNAQGGGVYATEWTSDAISIWFFPRGSIPSDITSGNPLPAGWGEAAAVFSGGCDIDSHFQNQQIVFDTTFCGDWAGAVWSTDPVCSPQASTCEAFVQNNPSAFAKAYWSVNSLKVYQDSGAASSSIPSAAPATWTSIEYMQVVSESTQAVSVTQSRTRHYSPPTPVVTAVGEQPGGEVAVSTAFNDPDAKGAPTKASVKAAASAGVFAQVSSQTTQILAVSISSTITSTTTVTQKMSNVSLTATSTMAAAATSTIPNTGSYVTVSALDSFDFPSPGEPQTAGVPVPKKRRHIHRHMIRRQERKRHGFQ